MSEYVSSQQMAEIWGVSARQVAKMCKDGRILGAKMDHGKWVIPRTAVKPIDRRKKIDEMALPTKRLPLPIGITNFKDAVSRYYYVDKTLLLKEILDDGAKAILITRPRRFGKTLTADMVRVFFEKTDEDTGIYFRNLAIGQYGKEYMRYQGQYPVVYLSLKDANGKTWQKTRFMIYDALRKEYKRHSELLDSKKLMQDDKVYFSELVSGKVPEEEIDVALANLMEMLHRHYGQRVVLIVDEYDVPIQQGYTNGYYDDVVDFVRRLFSTSLKDNSDLEFGFLTGILRVAKESIFSGLNNLRVYTVLDNKYSQYFGFTPDEVKTMAMYYESSDKFDEICAWYDGYRFGSTDIFNPWSVLSYFDNGCTAKPYWRYTSGNDIVAILLKDADQEIINKLCGLLQGQSISTCVDTGIVYPDVTSSPDNIFSFLLMVGYLKSIKEDVSTGSGEDYYLEIPNREIEGIYRKEILGKAGAIVTTTTAKQIQRAILAGDSNKLQSGLNELLLRSASFFDTVGENFYHGLMLGMCAAMKEYRVTSNRESGDGRYDLCLEPISKNLPAFLIELKACSGGDSEKLKQLAQDALAQILEKKYAVSLMAAGIRPVICFGVAFSGKTTEVAVFRMDTSIC